MAETTTRPSAGAISNTGAVAGPRPSRSSNGSLSSRQRRSTATPSAVTGASCIARSWRRLAHAGELVREGAPDAVLARRVARTGAVLVERRRVMDLVEVAEPARAVLVEVDE